MKTFALAIMAGAAQAVLNVPSNVGEKFMKFITEHNKFYETVEEFEDRF